MKRLLIVLALLVACAPASIARSEPARRAAGAAEPEPPKRFVIYTHRNEQNTDWADVMTIQDARTGMCWIAIVRPGYNGQPVMIDAPRGVCE